MGSLRPSSVFFFKLELFSLKVFSEEFFLRILKASPLTNSFFNIWRVTRGKMCAGAKSFPFVLNVSLHQG